MPNAASYPNFGVQLQIQRECSTAAGGPACPLCSVFLLAACWAEHGNAISLSSWLQPLTPNSTCLTNSCAFCPAGVADHLAESEPHAISIARNILGNLHIGAAQPHQQHHAAAAQHGGGTTWEEPLFPASELRGGSPCAVHLAADNQSCPVPKQQGLAVQVSAETLELLSDLQASFPQTPASHLMCALSCRGCWMAPDLMNSRSFMGQPW